MYAETIAESLIMHMCTQVSVCSIDSSNSKQMLVPAAAGLQHNISLFSDHVAVGFRHRKVSHKTEKRILLFVVEAGSGQAAIIDVSVTRRTSGERTDGKKCSVSATMYVCTYAPRARLLARFTQLLAS